MPYLHLLNYVNIFTSFFDCYIEQNVFIYLEVATDRATSVLH